EHCADFPHSPAVIHNGSMHVIIWEFHVKPEFWSIFLEEYSSNGIWAQLFRQADGYRGTTLLLDNHQQHCAVTIDRWATQEDFENFKALFADEYHALDQRCAVYTED